VHPALLPVALALALRLERLVLLRPRLLLRLRLERPLLRARCAQRGGGHVVAGRRAPHYGLLRLRSGAEQAWRRHGRSRTSLQRAARGPRRRRQVLRQVPGGWWV
jgi:hypothetical protein